MTIRDYVKSISSVHYLRFPVVADLTDSHVIHRYCYAACVSESRRIPSWCAYSVELGNLLGDIVLSRNFHRTLDCTIPVSAYRGSGFDMGHLAPLASYRANRWAGETNDTCNIVPQTANLNRGAWLSVENEVRAAARKWDRVWVVAMPVWKEPFRKLDGVEVPSHYAKVIAIDETNVRCFLLPQVIERSADPLEYETDLQSLIDLTGVSPF